MTATPDPALVSALIRLGLIDEADSQVRFDVLTGGVSSDIWKVETNDRRFCVKRALPKLKVKADWQAPIERNRFEVAWYQIANSVCPGVAPRVLAHDPDAMLCAMEYLEPASHKLWKLELRDGRADPRQAAECGRRLAPIPTCAIRCLNSAGARLTPAGL